MDIPNSIKVVLVIDHWPFGHTQLTAMVSLSNHEIIAFQCVIPNAQSNLH